MKLIIKLMNKNKYYLVKICQIAVYKIFFKKY